MHWIISVGGKWFQEKYKLIDSGLKVKVERAQQK